MSCFHTIKSIDLATFIAAGFTAVLFYSCEEIGPVIDLTGTFDADTTYVTTEVEAPQVKNVLLEEFTGVRCVNCPKGHEILDELETQYGSRFIAVSAHSEFQSEPYDDDPDLNNPDADDLEELLGPVFAKPSGSVDRKAFPGESLAMFRGKWATYVAQQMTATTPVNISINIDYDESIRAASASVTLHYTAEDTLDSRLTVMVLEDNIQTIQLDDPAIDSSYVQMRVLRKILPSVSGMPLTVSREAGRVIVRSFKIDVPADWNDENLRLIAFVHRSEQTMEVLHVQQERIKQ
jgi:hypothetical protein